MRKSRFTEAQIIGMIKEQEAGLPTSDLCRKHGCSTKPQPHKLKTETEPKPSLQKRLSSPKNSDDGQMNYDQYMHKMLVEALGAAQLNLMSAHAEAAVLKQEFGEREAKVTMLQKENERLKSGENNGD